MVANPYIRGSVVVARSPELGADLTDRLEARLDAIARREAVLPREGA